MADTTRGEDGGRLDRAWERTWAGIAEAVVGLIRAIRAGEGEVGCVCSLYVQAAALLLCALPARHAVDVHRKRFAEDVLMMAEAAAPTCALQRADVAIWGDCQSLGLDPDEWRESCAVH